MRIERLRGWALLAFLALCVLLGGASARNAGAPGNAMLQIGAILLILLSLWHRRDYAFPHQSRGPIWIGLVFAALVLLSIVPLPPSLWESLPGREPVAAGYRLLGGEVPSVPLSLGAHQSIASLLWLLPPAAVFLLVVQSPSRHRKRLPWVLIGLAAVSILLGAAQLLGGTGSPLRFYSITNNSLPVGFFSNANHLGTLLLAMLPLTGYLAARAVSKSGNRAQTGSGMLMAGSIAAFVLIGIAMIGSLAGFGLAAPAAAASFLIFRRAAYGPLSWKAVAAIGAVLVFFLGLALVGPLNSQAFSEELTDQPASRATFAATTAEAIGDSFPVGTGLGTFQEVYRTFEDPNLTSREYVNHAHNDYLEVVLELGLPGLLLMLAFLAWWAMRSWAVWRSDFAGANLARAGSVIILIVLLHSVVDYPLRTSAIAAVFAMACAFMVPPPPPRERRRSSRDEPAEGDSLRHLEAD